MKKIFGVILMMISLSALAANDTSSVAAAGFSKLSETEKAEIIRQVAEKADQKVNGVAQLSSPEKVEKWVQIGANIGQGLAGAAKELGIAVNDFSKTGVGQITVALIVWHVLGNTLMHIIGGIMVIVIGLSFMMYFYRKEYSIRYEYNKEKTNIFGNHPLLEKHVGNVHDNSPYFIITAFILIAGNVVMFTSW